MNPLFSLSLSRRMKRQSGKYLFAGLEENFELYPRQLHIGTSTGHSKNVAFQEKSVLNKDTKEKIW